jgi:hypothetical protein
VAEVSLLLKLTIEDFRLTNDKTSCQLSAVSYQLLGLEAKLTAGSHSSFIILQSSIASQWFQPYTLGFPLPKVSIAVPHSGSALGVCLALELQQPAISMR